MMNMNGRGAKITVIVSIVVLVGGLFIGALGGF